MSEEPDHLVLRYLRRLDEKIDLLTDRMNDMIVRLSAVERDIAALKVDFAAMQARMDGFDRRLARVEKRLELVDV